MAASEFMLNATHIEELARSTRNDSVSFEEDDPDTIRVEPRGARKRRRQDSGVHLDEGFEGLPAQTLYLSGKNCAASENELNCFQPSSVIMTQTTSIASNEDNGRDQGTAFKQTLIEADQMVLLPVATLSALQNEMAELRNTFRIFKEDTQKQLASYDDALNSQLASAETETNVSDDGDGFDQAELEDRAARKLAVKRVRRIARDHHSGGQRAHLEFMADIVGVNHKSKVDGPPRSESMSSTKADHCCSYPSATALEGFPIQSSGTMFAGVSLKIMLPSCGDIRMRVVLRSRTSWRSEKTSSGCLTEASSDKFLVVIVRQYRD
jgi:hypothetical protein